MTRNIGVNFGGQYLVHPGAYSQLSATAMGNNGAESAKTIVFLGTSESGQPGKVNWFSSYFDAANYLRSGDLLTAGQLAWSPSGDGVGAGQIGFVRVSPALQASLSQGSLTGTSIGYGATWNKIQAKLEAGTVSGTRKFTMFFYPDNTTEVYDNIGNIFTIQYTGTLAVGQLTITKDATSGKATGLQLLTGATTSTATAELSYDFTGGQWQNINQVIADINTHSDFTASMVTVGNHNIAPSGLDSVTAQDIKTAVYTATALKADFLLQTQASQLATFAFSTATFPANFAFTSFSGGTDGAVPTDWTNSLQLLYGQGADIVVPLTSNASVHAAVASFVERQSNNERNEMVGFYGGALGESVDQTIGRSMSLNSSRAVLTYPGISRQAADGSTTLLPPYHTAAMVAGRVAGLGVGEALTLNNFNLIGLETVLQSGDVTRLIEAGVVAIEYYKNRSNQGYRSVLGVTTYQADNNPVFVDISVRMLADTLNIGLRQELEAKYIGNKGTQASISLIKNDVQSYLDQQVREGVIVAYDPASVSVTLVNNHVYVTYSAQPVESIDYILITGNMYQLPLTA